jgi:hypothetical protein
MKLTGEGNVGGSGSVSLVVGCSSESGHVSSSSDVAKTKYRGLKKSRTDR